MFLLVLLLSINAKLINAQSVESAELLNDQLNLINKLENEWNELNSELKNLNIISSSLKEENSQLLIKLSEASSTISSLSENLNNFKNALKSNQNDTANLIALFAEAQQEIDSIKIYVAKLEKDKRHLRNARITCISFAALGIGSIILGNTLPNENARKILNAAGIGMVISSGVTFTISFVF